MRVDCEEREPPAMLNLTKHNADEIEYHFTKGNRRVSVVLKSHWTINSEEMFHDGWRRIEQIHPRQTEQHAFRLAAEIYDKL